MVGEDELVGLQLRRVGKGGCHCGTVGVGGVDTSKYSSVGPDTLVNEGILTRNIPPSGDGCDSLTGVGVGIEVAGGGVCERLKFRRGEEGGIVDEAEFCFGVHVIVDCIFILLNELGFEGPVLPLLPNSALVL